MSHFITRYIFFKEHVPKDQDLTKSMLFLLFYQDVHKWNAFRLLQRYGSEEYQYYQYKFCPDSICAKKPKV